MQGTISQQVLSWFYDATPRSEHHGQVQLPGRLHEQFQSISVIWIPLHLRSIVNMKVLKTQKISKGCDYSSPFTAVHGSHDQCWWGPHAHVDWRHLCLLAQGPMSSVEMLGPDFCGGNFNRRMGKSMEIDLIKNKCGREFFVGLIGKVAAF